MPDNQSPIPCQRQMYERYEVARVKTTEEFGEHHYSIEGRIIREWFEEHRKLFGAALRRRMRVREMDKTGAAKSYLSGYVLGIYLAMPKRSVASEPNIFLH